MVETIVDVMTVVIGILFIVFSGRLARFTIRLKKFGLGVEFPYEPVRNLTALFGAVLVFLSLLDLLGLR